MKGCSRNDAHSSCVLSVDGCQIPELNKGWESTSVFFITEKPGEVLL